MSFVVLACSEIRSEKFNLELPFEARPTVGDVLDTIERVFRFEVSNLSSPSIAPEPIFTVQMVQIYVDESRQWVELTSPHQLHMYDQLFVVRKYITPSENARREIPRPRSSSYFNGRAASVSMPPPTSQPATARGTVGLKGIPEVASLNNTGRSNTTTTPSGRNPAEPYTPLMSSRTNAGSLSATISQALLDTGRANPQEVIRVVFEAADKRRQGVLTSYDLGNLIKQLSVHVQQDSIDEMFEVFAQSGTGSGRNDAVMSFKDFTLWAESYDSLATTMFERILSLEKENRLSDAQRDSAVRIAELVRQRQEMEETIRRLDVDINRENDRKRCLEDELDEVLRDRQADMPEDQALVDKEIRVQHHRHLLRLEENDYAQAAGRRGHRVLGGNAPLGASGRSYSQQSLGGTPIRTGSMHAR